MIQTRKMSKTVDQLSSIIAKHLAAGSDFAMFDKEEQRLVEESNAMILSNLEDPEIAPMRKTFETVEIMLQRVQMDLLKGTGQKQKLDVSCIQALLWGSQLPRFTLYSQHSWTSLLDDLMVV